MALYKRLIFFSSFSENVQTTTSPIWKIQTAPAWTLWGFAKSSPSPQAAVSSHACNPATFYARFSSAPYTTAVKQNKIKSLI